MQPHVTASKSGPLIFSPDKESAPDGGLALVRRETTGVSTFLISPTHPPTPALAPIPAEWIYTEDRWYIRAQNNAVHDVQVGKHRLGAESVAVDSGTIITFGSSRFVAFLASGGVGLPLHCRLDDIITASPNMVAALCDACFAAPTRLPVLITGESGTGKELVARAIHRLSSAGSGPFVAVNCAALPESLAESELFGHARGAFTGAVASRRGLFEQAHQGTLFLDEIGELSPSIQAKLLRVLETGEIRRLGSEDVVRVNFRLIAATHRDLPSPTPGHSLSFRADLYYRISVLTAALPALRDRPDDIRTLCYCLLGRLSSVPTIHPLVIATLLSYEWPGNVRELRNVLLRADARAGGGDITLDHLDSLLSSRTLSKSQSDIFTEWRSHRIAQEFEKHHGHHKRTYQALGISKSSFYRWLRTYRMGADIAPPNPNTPAYHTSYGDGP